MTSGIAKGLGAIHIFVFFGVLVASPLELQAGISGGFAIGARPRGGVP